MILTKEQIKQLICAHSTLVTWYAGPPVEKKCPLCKIAGSKKSCGFCTYKTITSSDAGCLVGFHIQIGTKLPEQRQIKEYLHKAFIKRYRDYLNNKISYSKLLYDLKDDYEIYLKLYENIKNASH